MMKISRLWCSLLLVILVTTIQAQDCNQHIKEIQTVAKTTKTITASYTEEIFSAAFLEPVKGTGTFLFQLPNSMRWEQNGDSKRTMLLHNKQIRLSENGTERDLKFAKQIGGRISAFMLQLVQADFNNSKEFEVSCTEANKNYQFNLKPKSSTLQKIYAEIIMEFSKETKHLSKLTFIETNGDKRCLTFNKVSYNTPIKPEQFTVLN